MYLKLLIYQQIKTEYYLTLDADVFFTNKCDISYLISNDKAHYQKYKSYDNWTQK